jgi:hypothetical protein
MKPTLMRSSVLACGLLASVGCGPGPKGQPATEPTSSPDAGGGPADASVPSNPPAPPAPSDGAAQPETSTPPLDPYRWVYDGVDADRVIELIKDMTGYNSVTLNGETFRITDRWSKDGKSHFRAYFRHYFESLGMPVNALDYPTQHALPFGDPLGHNLEAVLPGTSSDSVVLIVHYDSAGEPACQVCNPAVDDDMTGMATMLETARLLSSAPWPRHYTVRFVATDYEEWPLPTIEGARHYATYLKALAAQQGFRIVAAVDDEQSGWNCRDDNLCSTTTADTLDVITCSTDGKYQYPAMATAAVTTLAKYSNLTVALRCSNDDSDRYAMWEIGTPAVEISEHNPGDNPHFDIKGGDTLDRLNRPYYVRIARAQAVFSATNIGLGP